jgi:hypothetical protein
LASGTLEEVHDVEFDKTKGSQDEDKSLDDVRGIQLSNAIKNMDVDELRPRQVIDEEYDQVQVLSNSNEQVDTNQASQVALMTMWKIKWLVHHLKQINQMSKQSSSKTPTNQYCKR